MATRLEQLERLYRISTIIHSTLDQQEALELIVREAVGLVHASNGSVVLINPTNGFLEIQASHGLTREESQTKLRVGEGITGWVAKFGRPALVPDVTKDDRYVKLNLHTRSELATPLEVDGRIRGVVNVDSDRPNAFSQDDQELMVELTRQAAGVIHNTWRYEQTRIRASLFESVIHVGEVINSTVDLEEALATITREAFQLMDARTCSVQLADRETGKWLELKACYGAGEAYRNKPPVQLADSFLGAVINCRRPHQIENIQVSNMYQQQEMARAEGLSALLSVPLVYQDRAIGTINIYKGQPHRFSNQEISLLTALAGLSAIAIEKARLYERAGAAEELLRQNEKLSALGLLAAEVAHEIRNPLTVMKMLYHSLDLDFAEDDPRREDARIMGEKMDHLNRIVDQILAFARSAEPRKTRVKVNEMVEDLRLLVGRKLARHGIELQCKLTEDLPVIRADAAQLSQVFLNLTLNAIEAMPEGGQLEIETRLLRATSMTKSRFVRVGFSDTGGGMDEEQRRHAFTSLLRSEKPDGTGLGLAIVGRIIEAHQGRIKIKSRANGTTLRITLPVAS